jgi:hypothetical protein
MSSATGIDVSKFDTVTPTNRTPFLGRQHRAGLACVVTGVAPESWINAYRKDHEKARQITDLAGFFYGGRSKD